MLLSNVSRDRIRGGAPPGITCDFNIAKTVKGEMRRETLFPFAAKKVDSVASASRKLAV